MTARAGTANVPGMACRRGCILVVDDDVETREALVEFARGVGCCGVAACGGKDALRWLERGSPPCLVLVDLDDVRFPGEEFVRQVRRGPAGAELTLVSMSAGEPRPPPPGVDAQLAKPFRLDALWPIIERSCRATIWIEPGASLAVS